MKSLGNKHSQMETSFIQSSLAQVSTRGAEEALQELMP